MEKKKQSSKTGISPKPKKRIQKSKSTNWEAEGDEIILMHDDLSSTSLPMGMGENGFSHNGNNNSEGGLFDEVMKGDDIMTIITSGKNSVRDRKHSFTSLYLHKKGREKTKMSK